jgi:hypothetical protein
MAARFWRYGAAILVACALSTPSTARAGVILITRGETISHVGDVAPQHRANAKIDKVGYKYGYWGIFWIDLWTWDGTYCVYEGDHYKPIQPSEAALLIGKSERELGKPFLYQVPLGWLIFGPLIVIGIIATIVDKVKQAKATPFYQDVRYQSALHLMNEDYARRAAETRANPAEAQGQAASDESAAAFEAAVKHLVDTGIDREQAERSLTLMTHGPAGGTEALEKALHNAGAAFEQAVRFLVANGVASEEAERNLALLIHVLGGSRRDLVAEDLAGTNLALMILHVLANAPPPGVAAPEGPKVEEAPH